MCSEGTQDNILLHNEGKTWLTHYQSQSSELLRPAWLTGRKSSRKSLQETCKPRPGCLHTLAPRPDCPGARPSQTRLLTHSDGDVVVPIVLGDQGHHRPVPGWVCGVDCDELFSAVLGEPVYPDGVAHSIGEEEHFNLGEQSKWVSGGQLP